MILIYRQNISVPLLLLLLLPVKIITLFVNSQVILRVQDYKAARSKQQQDQDTGFSQTMDANKIKLLQELRELCRQLARENGVNSANIFNGKT